MASLDSEFKVVCWSLEVSFGPLKALLFLLA
jgi:hypothetical protein